MFGKHHTLKQLSTGIAVAASLAVVAAPSALGAHDSWYRNAVSQSASRPSVTFITDTLGGNGHVTKATSDVLARYVANHAGPATQVQAYRFITDTLGGNGNVAKATPDVLARYVANHAGPATQVQGYRFITDTLGGNGQPTQVSSYNPQAYVPGGSSPAVSSAIQALGYGRTASPAVAASPSGSTFNWGDAGIGAGMVGAGLLLLLLCVARLRMSKRPAITT